ncbi:MAG: ABC transporter ATP-binding protein [Planctomycetota bacterium]
MAEDLAIHIQGLWKRYGLPFLSLARRRGRSLFAQSPFEGPSEDGGTPWALREVSLEVRRGETLGVIGPNGAGKSTLLKILAGVSPPTRGRVEVRGSVFPMIELNAGLHPELSGRENVHLLGAVMGLGRREVEQKLPAIEAFSGLGNALERPIRTYSSGMRARLGFSVAMNVDADILLIDEVLAVGDAKFQNQCLAALHRLGRAGKTRVFVSHNLDQVQYLTERTLVLDAGEPIALEESAAAIRAYERRIFLDRAPAGGEGEMKEKAPAGARVLSCTVADASGRSQTDLAPEEPLRVRIEYELYEEVADANPQFSFVNPDGIPVLLVYAAEHGAAPAAHGPGRYAFVTRLPALWLSEGRYSVNFAFRSLASFETWERRAGIGFFTVRHGARRRRWMILAPEAQCTVERTGDLP